jgi:CHAT domain-containing protein
VSYRPYNATYKDIKESFGEPRYAAYVLGNQGDPASVDLGDAKSIHTAVTALREALRDPQRNDVKLLARALDERVMRPLRKLLGGKRKLLLSPDGSLNLVPFGALVDEQDQYLVRQFSFTYLTSGRDLLRLRERTESRGAPVIIADPDFGPKSPSGSDRGLKVKSTAASTPEPGSANAVNFAEIYFGPLPGTEGEAQGIKGILPSANLLTKKQATEAAIKRVEGPSILHVATHGYFLEDVIVSSSPSINRGLLIKPTKHYEAGSANTSN